VTRADLAAHLDAVTVGQAKIEQRDIGRGRRDPPVGLLGRRRLSHHLDARLSLEQLADPAAHDLVVVEQEDPRHPAIVVHHDRLPTPS
jgi:hypothetical protein